MTPEEWEQCDNPRKMLNFLIWDHARDPWKQSTPPAGGRIGGRQARLFAAACCRQIWPVLADERSRAGVEGAERCGEEPATALEMPALHWAAGKAEGVHAVLSDDPDDFAGVLAAARSWIDTGANHSVAARWRAALASPYAAHAAYCAAATARYACEARRNAAWTCGEKTALSAVMAATVWSDDVDAALVAGWLVGPRSGHEAFDAACGPARTMQANLLRDIVGNPFHPVDVNPAWLTRWVAGIAKGIYADRAFDRMPILGDALEDAGCDEASILAHCRGSDPHVLGCRVIDLLLGKE